jgi:iron(III) transport system substrate-binding protein
MARLKTLTLALTLILAAAACDKSDATDTQIATTATSETATGASEAKEAQSITLYCGRNEEMIRPVVEMFTKETGIEVKAQYAKSAELAATLVEEGDASPADLFFAQDVSTLGLLSKEGKLEGLPKESFERVPATYRDADGNWVGITGRARVLAYNTENVKPEELPSDVDELIDPKWKGQLGWAPENASFQSFVAAMIVERGPDETKKWLEAVMALEPKAYPSNTPMVTAIGRGEIKVGLTNHYYLYRLKAEHGDDFAAANHYFKSGKSGSLVNAAGVGIVNTSKNKEAAAKFIEFLLSDEAQKYFADQTHEFPLIERVEAGEKLPRVTELNPPPTDLSALGQLEDAVNLLREVGALK